jgi:1,4-dihydroxy-2-naphthoyl-CoA hydrolase
MPANDRNCEGTNMAVDVVSESAQQGLIKLLGIEFLEISPVRVVATMTVTDDHLQPYGYLHGGANAALAETVASVGGMQSCPPEYSAFGMEINANHIRPVRSGTLTATAVPLHRGRTSQVWDVKIVDEQSRLVCVSRCTLAVIQSDPS